MTDPETALAVLWARDEAPEVDPAFELAITARIGRRQVIKEIGEVVVWAAPAAAVTWAVWPSVTETVFPLMRGAGELAPVAVIAGATAFALWSASRLLGLRGLDFGVLEVLLPRAHFAAPDEGFD